jgi:hypothetical protein
MIRLSLVVLKLQIGLAVFQIKASRFPSLIGKLKASLAMA